MAFLNICAPFHLVHTGTADLVFWEGWYLYRMMLCKLYDIFETFMHAIDNQAFKNLFYDVIITEIIVFYFLKASCNG